MNNRSTSKRGARGGRLLRSRTRSRASSRSTNPRTRSTLRARRKKMGLRALSAAGARAKRRSPLTQRKASQGKPALAFNQSIWSQGSRSASGVYPGRSDTSRMIPPPGKRTRQMRESRTARHH